LKRFKGSNTKQNSLVHFPVEGLDMTEFIVSEQVKSKKEKKPSILYDLFAVSNHTGTLSAGHYTALTKN